VDPMERAPGQPGPRRWIWTAALLAVYVVLSLGVVWRHGPIDDAYISFRYARHLAAGQGLVFNPGEARVEGYSSLTWVLVLAAGARLGLSLPLWSKGIALLLGLGILLVLAAREHGRAGLLAAAWLALCLPMLYHVLNGLDTALMALLLTVLACLPPDTPGRRRARYAAAALLPLTRPEGMLCVLLWALADWLTDRRRLPRHEMALAAVAVAAAAGQMVFRLTYYGDWVANSARAKLVPLSLALGPGLRDLGRFLLQGSGWGLLPLLAVVGVVLSRRGGQRTTVARGLFLVLLLPPLAASGGDSFPLWRFCVPLAPVLALAAAEGLELLLAAMAPDRRAVLRMALAGLVAVALVLPWGGFLQAMEVETFWVGHWADLGRRLAATFPPGTRVAVCAAGALPFHAGFPAIDMLGLNDAHIARVPPDRRYFYPGHQRHDGPYVLSRRPDLILLANGPIVAGGPAPFDWRAVRPYEQDLAADPRFTADYLLIHFPLDGERRVQLFAHRDFARRLGFLPE
jgi:arabinofuranosyltransferase